MTDDRMFERNAQAWLEQGPATAPQSAIASALKTIETTPQQRTLRVPRRFSSMFTPLRLAGAAAIVAVTFAGGYMLFARPPTVGPSPRPSVEQSPNPSPSADPTPSASASVDALQSLQAIRDGWQSSGERDDPQFVDPMNAEIVIDDTGLRITTYRGVHSAISTDPDGSLVLTLESRQTDLARVRWPCTTGDEGRYRAQLSPDEQTLTLALLSDNCAARADVLEGEWTRQQCTEDYPYCVREALPGAQTSIFKPFDGGKSGSFTYTLPTGWTVNSGSPMWTGPESAAAMSLSLVDSYNGPAVYLFSNVVAESKDADSCLATFPDTQSATGIADWLESLDSVIAHGRTAVSVGGLSGVQLDISMAPATYFCVPDDGAGRGSVPLFGYMTGATNELARYIMLDRDGGILLLIVKDWGESDLESFISQATPIIETFQFLTTVN